jgi:crotonobetainyl-CoA:carnitine CoA-transferase CaiB-like acyl-CoA transferase
MYEAIVHLLGERVLGAAASGHPPARPGNRSPFYAPQGVYPCAGNDEWLALSVRDEAQWQALCDQAATDELAALRLLDREARQAQHDRIDTAMCAWTATCSKEDLARALQARGIAAAPVQKASDMPFDEQLLSREAYRPVVHPEPVLGHVAHPHLTLSWRTEGRVRPRLHDATPEGSDNRAVLRQWLGLRASEVVRLLREGALLTPVDKPVVRYPGVVGAPMDPDFAERLGLQPADEAPA